ncbi:DUF6473 family protein [Ketogulonicigenium robustum]|uniref:DUF6473 family protein n=1 Tax=Ketogulonicigenium robustum TaxID=92947 RepID=UPI000A26972F|nr:DUF6473 family protein [Ketogulonicigenium robustum]
MAHFGPKTCHYGTSKLAFRAPARTIGRDYIAFLGGSQTFAGTITAPYPNLVEEELGVPCINLATDNGGLEAIMRDSFVSETSKAAHHIVLELTSPATISNRYYMVDPQDNTRISSFSARFLQMCKGVALDNVTAVDMLPAALPHSIRLALEAEIRTAWAARTHLFLRFAARPATLLFLGDSEDLALMGQSALMQLASAGYTMLQIRPRRGAGGAIDTAGHQEISRRLLPVLHGSGFAATLPANQSFAVNSGTAVKRSATRP